MSNSPPLICPETRWWWTVWNFKWWWEIKTLGRWWTGCKHHWGVLRSCENIFCKLYPALWCKIYYVCTRIEMSIFNKWSPCHPFHLLSCICVCCASLERAPGQGTGGIAVEPEPSVTFLPRVCSWRLRPVLHFKTRLTYLRWSGLWKNSCLTPGVDMARSIEELLST